ncbi:MAG: hypothetical protein PHN45_00020 [Methylococcales bacterium]|nr:hypothetical protein [Methylococcales bacterium]
MTELFYAVGASGILLDTRTEYEDGSSGTGVCKVYRVLDFPFHLPPIPYPTDIVLLDTSVSMTPIAGGWHYQKWKFNFTGNAPIIAGQMYMAVWENTSATTVSQNINAHDNMHSWRGAVYHSLAWVCELWVTSTTSIEDIFINGPAAAIIDVKYNASNASPTWTTEGTGVWPTSHITGANLAYDTNDTTTFPANTALTIGELTSPSDCNYSLLNGTLQIGGATTRTTIDALFSILTFPKTTASTISTCVTLPTGWHGTNVQRSITPYIVSATGAITSGTTAVFVFRMRYSDGTNVHISYPNDATHYPHVMPVTPYEPSRCYGTAWVLPSNNTAGTIWFETERLAADGSDDLVADVYLYDVGISITLNSFSG